MIFKISYLYWAIQPGVSVHYAVINHLIRSGFNLRRFWSGEAFDTGAINIADNRDKIRRSLAHCHSHERTPDSLRVLIKRKRTIPQSFLQLRFVRSN